MSATKHPVLLLFLGSLVVAVLAFCEPFMTAFQSSVFFSLGFSALWVLLVFVGLILYRKRGLWLLLGAPFALIWPITLGLFAAQCALLGPDCP